MLYASKQDIWTRLFEPSSLDADVSTRDVWTQAVWTPDVRMRDIWTHSNWTTDVWVIYDSTPNLSLYFFLSKDNASEKVL